MFVKLVRIGKDAELKQSNSGKSFLSLSVVYDIGYGENKQSQWMSLVMFGAQAEKLAQHLTKRANRLSFVQMNFSPKSIKKRLT